MSAFEWLPLATIDAAVGTPCYVYDGAAIRRRVVELRSALPPNARLFYSLKAHTNTAILRLLRACGTGVDACSLGDLAFAESAGFVGDEISFHAHGCPPEALCTALDRGATVVADSVGQVEQVARLRPGSSIAVRINPGIVAGFTGLVHAGSSTAKFGVHASQIPQVLEACARGQLHIVGLHGHIGSDIFDPGPHLELLERLLALRSSFPDLKFIDIGGGWGTPFLPKDAGDEYPPLDREPPYPLQDLSIGIQEVFARHEGAEGLELRVESGAFLLMAAGLLLARIMDVKEPGIDHEGEMSPRFACSDTSYSHVHSAVVHDTFHEVLLVGDHDRPLERQTVTGNLMQAGDVLALDRLLPRLERGDLVAILRCGAYKATLASTFNGHPRPAEVLVDGATVRLVRRRESAHELLALQVDEAIG